MQSKEASEAQTNTLKRNFLMPVAEKRNIFVIHIKKESKEKILKFLKKTPLKFFLLQAQKKARISTKKGHQPALLQKFSNHKKKVNDSNANNEVPLPLNESVSFYHYAQSHKRVSINNREL